MKVAVSVPEDVFQRAEKLARRLGKSRSRLYSEALAEYLARHSPDTVTEAMDAVCESVETRLEPPFAAAARETLRRTDW
jgi:metal-responsive CopG/Arc/MetJ family transcriptional regulator